MANMDGWLYAEGGGKAMEERRQAPRCSNVPIQIHQCVVTHLGKETWLEATAIDFSAKGLCLLLNDSLDSGESVYVLASIRPEGQPPRDLSVNGVTTYCRPSDSGRWRVGLQFLDLTDGERHDWALFTGCSD